MEKRTFRRIVEQLKKFPHLQSVMFGGFGEPMAHAVAFMGSFWAIRKRAKAYNAGYELVRIYGANRLNIYLGDRRICATPCRRLKRWPEK